MWHYGMHLCHKYFPSKTFEISGSDDREYMASRLHNSSAGSKRPANALNDLCKVIR
ncbi:hypothetical protein L210DRAFT_3554661 [Boletus edulis BED1]|uniref:Uncharacterized protein n=1 Tax=Boletus edulis BED1 TaxID=1328754 RepID=A0AAD4BDS9_BOLED|nr:hypothetical protein L210DRAFT_3573307 [Boletus edulis BED1]KAF8433867.1 hypothetical protein L210DRAFT_3554661 [Boletus edulis BED1]